MDQTKTGSFIRMLRKEKQLTQEQMGDYFNVSRRTVSRWETGRNMPDLDVLIEMADYFEVDLRELLDGERKEKKMNKELEETVIKVADYSNEEKRRMMKRMHLLFIAGLAAAVIYTVMLFTDSADNFIGSLCLGITFGMMIVGVIMTSRHFEEIQKYKMKLLARLRK